VRHYEVALQALELADPPEERRRCELLLAVGETLWSAGEFQRSKETFLRAAEVARALGDPEPLAHAALGAGGRGTAFETGVVDEVLVGLLEEALAALGPGESALRARVMARLAPALTFSDERRRIPSLAKEASEIARRAGDPVVLASVLRDIRWALWAPDNVDQRLALAGEIVELAEDVGDRAMALETRILRSSDLMEKGDLSAVDRELEVCLPLAEELRQPYPKWAAATFAAMRALLEGRFEEGEPLIHRALDIGQRAQNQNAVQLFGAQFALLRREQGRAGELEEMAKGLIAQYPRIPAWRAALAWLYMDQGREADARHIFEELAAPDFADLPRDLFWLISVSLLSEVCAFLGDADRAPRLYELLLPHADRCVVLVLSACIGSVSRSPAPSPAGRRRKGTSRLPSRPTRRSGDAPG
jgi:tetratricopeptide (TPR) repeat protein